MRVALSLFAAVALSCSFGQLPRGDAHPPAAPAASNDWARGAVFYEVFVRSFADSNGDGIGDLRGLIAKLDYLNDGNPGTTSDLEVDALWLMPVFKSPSYHGYDTTDYETINRDYGTNEDFALLCKEAHRRGMRVILDLVLNHTSSQHPWFLLSSSIDEIPTLFDFALSSALLEGLKTGSAAPIAARLAAIARTYPPGAIDAPFLTNHDQIRVATQLKGDPARLRTAAALLLTLPGAPFLYYGEEIGMRQPNNSDDEFKRTPMQWSSAPGAGFTTGRPWQRVLKDYESINVETETRDPASLLSRYRTLIRLRHSAGSLRRGSLELLPSEGGVLAFLRLSADETTLVVHNVGTSPATTGPLALAVDAASPLFADPGVAIAKEGAGWTVTLPAGSSGAWRLQRK